MSLVWNPDLLLGNQQIDEQHQRIFMILHKLIDAIAEHKGHEEVGSVLASASMFVAAHFKLEEDLMVQFGYPGLEPHRRAHQAVREKVDALVDQFHRDGLHPLDLVAFMQSWLGGHVQGEDRPLADFLNSQEEAAG
jgi:hemerythrin